MSPIVTRINEHAAAWPAKPALISANTVISYATLAQEIRLRAPGFISGDPWTPTFQGVRGALEESVNGLARLALGQMIVGKTSGSSGQAKTYCRSQASWLESFKASDAEFGINHDDVVAAPGQLTHSLFSYAVCQGLYTGATVLVSDSFRPDRILNQLREHQATVLYSVPTQLKLLVAAAPDSIHSLRWVLSSGARWFGQVLVPLREMFSRAQIAEFYGASETSFITLANHTHDGALPAGSVGRAISGVNLRIEPESQRIWASSPALFDRYQNEPPVDFYEEVDSLGVRWISVGDQGEVDDSGYLFLLGRESRRIVTSGKNLYPEEIEACLSTHPAVMQVAVMSVTDALRGERLVAVLKPRVCAEPWPLNQWLHLSQRKSLMDHLRPLLDDYKIPRFYLAVADWPETHSGKTNVAQLKAMVESLGAIA